MIKFKTMRGFRTYELYQQVKSEKFEDYTYNSFLKGVLL